MTTINLDRETCDLSASESEVCAQTTPPRHRATSARRIVRLLLRSLTSAMLLFSVAVFCFLAVGPHVLGYRTATMLSGSMVPHIRPGDVVVDVAEPISKIRVGQILTLQTPTPTHYVDSHRVFKIMHRHGHVFIKTKGDANPVPDPWTAELHGRIVWRVVAVVPKLGFAINALRSRGAHMLLVVIAPVLLVGLGVVEIWRRPTASATEARAAD